ncbi:hypothetical protein [Fusibacter sp. 3D3]|uniref:hypothetical protein n=1 Tax=Fusibacter sp. 3D3 TaxID=1048380 RepID=UPI0008578BBE|nr:hypothetical protein [Fusibacter sp. 3D3]GAU78899.1 hypothetical protein F3D3_3535 [Fusibacter sp. 3D3]
MGKYKLDYYVIDNPTLGSDSEIFGNYRKISKPAMLNVYVHRRPIADFELTYDYRATDIGITVNNLSYDLDHMGAYQNGITKIDYAYRKNAAQSGAQSGTQSGTQTGAFNWQTGLPQALNYGETLEIALTVTALEGATNSTLKTFTMPKEMPITLPSTLITERPEFNTQSIPTSLTAESGNAYDLKGITGNIYDLLYIEPVRGNRE